MQRSLIDLCQTLDQLKARLFTLYRDSSVNGLEGEARSMKKPSPYNPVNKVLQRGLCLYRVRDSLAGSSVTDRQGPYEDVVALPKRAATTAAEHILGNE